jgi:hypothetical protein
MVRLTLRRSDPARTLPVVLRRLREVVGTVLGTEVERMTVETDALREQIARIKKSAGDAAATIEELKNSHVAPEEITAATADLKVAADGLDVALAATVGGSGGGTGAAPTDQQGQGQGQGKKG